MPAPESVSRAWKGWFSLVALVVHPSAAADRPIHVDVDLVLVTVSVADPAGRPWMGLRAENFQLFEDRAPQRIAYFSEHETPVSLSLVFDQSGSMSDKLAKARQATRQLLEFAHPEDEFLLVPFADSPRADAVFARNPVELQNRLFWTPARGGTALLDAVCLGLTRLREGRHPRRALVVISDGGDNASRSSRREVLSLAAEAGAQIWAVGIHDNPRRAEEQHGALLLQALAKAGGGRHFWARDRKELEEAVARIARLVHHEYILGYYPLLGGLPGKWRRIEVQVNPGPARVYARSGYYAPASFSAAPR
jgi:Ca-activated chloride channel family protein